MLFRVKPALNDAQCSPPLTVCLCRQVRETQQTFTQLELDNLVSALRAASTEQREQIRLLSAKRDELRQRVVRLRDIAEQFNVPP